MDLFIKSEMQNWTELSYSNLKSLFLWRVKSEIPYVGRL